MCGICGIASPVGPPDPDRLAAMSDSLVHRGPDSGGIPLAGPVGPAPPPPPTTAPAGGDQPISNEDGSCTVVQNGEIYNFPELRRELEREGHTFRTHSDTEVHLHLYEQHGPDFARRLRGMFAVAIWDARRGRLVLARDRYGIKPLYYRHVGGVLEFASEVRALPTKRSCWRSCARACATRFGRTCSPTCLSASCSRAASTLPRSQPSQRRRARTRSTRSRLVLPSGASTSEPMHAASPSATGRTTTSCSSARTRPCCCRPSQRRSTSRANGAIR